VKENQRIEFGKLGSPSTTAHLQQVALSISYKGLAEYSQDDVSLIA
jgi:hypothetical protein